MLYRLQIALVFLAPVLLLAALYVLGDALGVRAPLLGRDYVIRLPLPVPPCCNCSARPWARPAAWSP